MKGKGMVEGRVEGMINSRWEEGGPGQKGGGGTREGSRDD